MNCPIDESNRVTLLGDAAHVIPPFAGVGVNIAMHDADDLAQALEKIVVEGVDIETALEEYEEIMMQRAGKNAELTAGNQGQFFGGESLDKTMEFLKSVFGG